MLKRANLSLAKVDTSVKRKGGKMNRGSLNSSVTGVTESTFRENGNKEMCK
jgi:hypothetical protein